MLGFGGEVVRVDLVIVDVEYAAYTPFASDLDGGDVGAIGGEGGPAVGGYVSVD